ncbi:hypothetical protein LINGRAHAP2_LOCUS20083, partial [Linum grandiflorum]
MRMWTSELGFQSCFYFICRIYEIGAASPLVFNKPRMLCFELLK